MAFHVLWRMLLMFDLKLIPESVTFAFNTCDEYSFNAYAIVPLHSDVGRAIVIAVTVLDCLN